MHSDLLSRFVRILGRIVLVNYVINLCVYIPLFQINLRSNNQSLKFVLYFLASSQVLNCNSPYLSSTWCKEHETWKTEIQQSLDTFTPLMQQNIVKFVKSAPPKSCRAFKPFESRRLLLKSRWLLANVEQRGPTARSPYGEAWGYATPS